MLPPHTHGQLAAQRSAVSGRFMSSGLFQNRILWRSGLGSLGWRTDMQATRPCTCPTDLFSVLQHLGASALGIRQLWSGLVLQSALQAFCPPASPPTA